MPPGDSPTLEVESAELVAGQGIVGDRFFGFKEGYKGQLTLFSGEIYDELCGKFQVSDRGPGAFRRNVIVRGMDLNSLIGKEFELQGIKLLGMAECSPCHWMEEAFSPGTEKALKGRGGLRAKILSNGVLRKDLIPAH